MRLRAIPKALPRFLAAWAIAFAALLGVASAIAQFFPSIAGPVSAAIGILVASAIAAGVYARRYTTPRPLPVSELLPEQLLTVATLSLECTTDRGPLLQVHGLTEEVYPGVPPMPPDRYEQWLLLNPQIFVCLFDSARSVLGYFDVFPLRSDFMRMLVEGHVGEQEIRREHILSPREAASVEALYLGGVAVREWQRHHGRRHAAILLWGLLRYLEHYYPAPPVRTVYAHAVTPEGERMLQNFGFTRVAEAEGRRDSYRLYAGRVTEELRELHRCNVPDFSGQVRVGWAPIPPRLQVVRGQVA